MNGNFRYEDRLHDGQIRLLKVHPGTIDEPLQCEIVTCNLNDDIHFAALSYVWGSEPTRKCIFCNGQTVEVTENLHGALVNYREKGHETLLWADAHCINQNDDIEKSQQVQLMAQIYERAELVIIWLGRELSLDELGLDLAYRLYDVFTDSARDPTAFKTADFEAVGIPVSDKTRWKALMALFERPWFERVWIIQEFLSARLCVMWCGQLEFPPDVLLYTAKTLISQRQAAIISAGMESKDVVPFLSLLGNANIVRTLKNALGPRGNRGCRLIELLWPLRAWKATDQRDKAFALAGLADGLPQGFVDYTLGVRDVYILTAKFVLWDNSSNPLMVFSYLTSDGCNFPSWVPTWDSNPHRRTPLASRYPLFTPPSELLEPRAEFEFPSYDVVAVKGKIIDTISSLHAYPYSDPSKITELLPQHSANISAWLNKCAQLIQKSQRYAEEDEEEVLWRLIVHDSKSPYGFDVPGKDYGDAFRAYREFTELGKPENMSGTEEWRLRRQACMSQSDVFQTSVGNFMPGRHSCSTASGYVGCAPLRTAVGDCICIFQGYPIPFVLRPTRKHGYYELVGEAYLQGVMNGEAFRSSEAAVEMINLV